MDFVYRNAPWLLPTMIGGGVIGDRLINAPPAPPPLSPEQQDALTQRRMEARQKLESRFGPIALPQPTQE
jgi:hypothetical protein